MELQVRLIAVLAIVVLQIAGSKGIAQLNKAKPTVFDDGRDSANTLDDPDFMAYTTPNYNAVDLTSIDTVLTPSTEIANKKYLRHLMDSASDMWASVKNTTIIPINILTIGNSLAYVAQNFNSSYIVQQPVNNAVNRIMNVTSLTDNVKMDINKSIKTIAKNYMDSSSMVKHIDMVRHTAQAATVVLSVAAALCQTLTSEAFTSYTKNTDKKLTINEVFSN